MVVICCYKFNTFVKQIVKIVDLIIFITINDIKFLVVTNKKSLSSFY